MDDLRSALELDSGALEEVMTYLAVRSYSDAKFDKPSYKPATETA